MNLYIGAHTDAGKRDNNEDCVEVVRPTDGSLHADAILIVADGMGGRANGEHASAGAVAVIRETLESLLATGEGETPPYEDALATAMRRANARVYEMSREKSGQRGMGTTCITAVIGKGGVSIAHVGDSRAYLLRDGILRRITDDHSYIEDQVRSGNLSDHDARTSRFRHVITKAIGVEATVRPDFETHELLDGDTLLLCTDGLSGVVDEAGMIQILSRTLNAQEASEYLVDAAKLQGSRDNISCIVMRSGGEPEPPTRAAAAAPVAEPGPESANGHTDPPASPARGRSGTNAAWLLVGAIAGTAGLLLGQIAMVKARHRPAAPPPAAISAPAAGLPTPLAAPSSYDPPRKLLLDKQLRPDILTGGDAGVVVAEADSGKLWSISPIGQVVPAGNLAESDLGDARADAPVHIATDQMGNVYVSSRADKVVRRYAPDGSLETSIAQGQLKDPSAIWVSHTGDIYVIDDGALCLIAAHRGASPAASAPSPPAPIAAAGAH